MKKKLLLSIIPCVVILALVITLLILQPWKAKAKYDGKATIVIVSDTLNIKDEVKYKKDDTLLGIMQEKYDTKTTTSEYGAFITEIKGVAQDEASGKYWMIYVDDKSSEVGISSIALEDGKTYKFALETFVWN